MPTRPKKRQLFRENILRSASRLFNRHGFNAVSIDNVMAEAGLTRGSFYTYFSSKTDLYAQSVARVVGEKRSRAAAIEPGRMRTEGVIRDYLSVRHFEDVDDAWPMLGLTAEILRSDPSVRQAFEAALRLLIEIFEQDMGRGNQSDRTRAFAIAALCVGGMVLARSVEDRGLADTMREAALATALRIGQW